MRVLGVCGSLQRASSNLTLLHDAARWAPTGMSIEIFDGIRDLPLFDPDLERGPEIAAVRAWRDAIAASDAVLIACPEYGHSLPGALKNAVDWVIGTAELETKIVAVTCSTPGPERGLRGLDALCRTLLAVRATLVGTWPTVRGDTYEPSLRALLQGLHQVIETADE